MTSLNECHSSTSASPQQRPLHSATLTVSVTLGGNGKRKMCESELPLTPSLPNSSPHLQPPSPDLSSRYSVRHVQRMQNDICFRCRQQGHWARECPLGSPNSKSLGPIAEKSDFPTIYCRCGHGPCEVKTAKNDRNFGKSYYACPIKRGRKCREFVQWCDDHIDESEKHPPPIKYPTCACGAGVCRKVKETSGPNEGRYYFACPIGEDHRACNFRLWEDILLGTPNIARVRHSGQKTLHDYWEGKQVDETNRDDLGKDGDPMLGPSKKMRITGDSEHSSVMAVSELPEGEDAVPKEAPVERGDHDETTELSTPPKHVGFPEFEIVDDLQDIDMIKLAETVEEKILSISRSRLSSPSKIHSRQAEFQRQLSAAAADVDAPFHGVFPSFDAIDIPRQESNHDGLSGESNQLLISNTDQHVQLSNGHHAPEISVNVVSPSISSPGNERKLMSKAERLKKRALFVQQQLLDELESFDPLDYESMRVAAEGTFDLLKSLSVEYEQFSKHFWEFINSASSLAEIQKSIQNGVSPEEHIQNYEEEKVRFSSIHSNHDKAKASLREEASRLRALLELETSKMEAQLGEINGNMKGLKIATEQADTARKLREEREANQIAVRREKQSKLQPRQLWRRPNLK